MAYIIKSYARDNQAHEMFILTASFNGNYRWGQLTCESKRFGTFGEARRLLNKISINDIRSGSIKFWKTTIETIDV